MHRRPGMIRGTARRTAHYSTSAHDPHSIRLSLRALLRDTAQPVAVVTSLMPGVSPTAAPHARFHGATLSSFSSIALDPHPLVAFSLRIPSRMAAALKAAYAVPTPHTAAHTPHMVVNVLSAAQAPTAVRFARTDLHPEPFASTPHALSADGLPVLRGALGALSCRLVAASWPLHDLAALERHSGGDAAWEGDGVASELFIAQVTRVEAVPPLEGANDALQSAPLIYYRRAYATTRGLPPPEEKS